MATFTPSWKKYEKDLHSEDIETNLKASDAFEAERNHALETDPEARKWEASRRERVAKDKPQWVKERRARDQEPLKEMIKELRRGGHFTKTLRPKSGFLLVKPTDHQQGVTQSGIYVPSEHTDYPNTAIVVRTSTEKYTEHAATIPAPCKQGEEILFRKGAGLEVSEKGENLLFISFEDVLGVLE